MPDDELPTRPTNERINQLLFECLERMETEGVAAIDAVCAQHPEDATRLRARLRTLETSGLLIDAERDAPERFPERLGDFRLLKSLGGGGMGVVYLAEQISLGRRVALKLIRPGDLYFPGTRERFRREVETVARLSHPNIVPIYTVGEDAGIPFFAMEHVEGCTLAQVLHELGDKPPERLSGRDLQEIVTRHAPKPREGSSVDSRLFTASWVEACFRIVRDVAIALEHAHERGVLHRDLKPSNVMITPSGRVWLLDFGLASLKGTSKLTRTGSQLGSLPYMTPEQIEGGATAPDPRGDLYSLGVTLYEALTLRLPYASAEASEMSREILAGQPKSIRERNAAVPSDAETVCLRAMERDPSRRYPTATDFARDLTNVLELRPIEARRASAALRVRRWAQRHPAWSVTIALSLVVLLGGPLAFGFQQHLANVRIEAKNTELAGALREAKEQREIAKAQFARAEENFRRALQAVDLVTKVGEEGLQGVPRMDSVRRSILESALAFHLGLLQQKGDDPALRREVARAHHRVGEIRTFLNQEEAARSSFEAASEIWKRELRERPDDAESRAGLAESTRWLGKTIVNLGKLDEAEPVLRDALAALPPSDEGAGTTPEELSRRAMTMYELCEILRKRQRLAEAERTYVEIVGLYDRILAARPGDDSALLQKATTLSAIGVIQQDAKRWSDAASWYRKSMAVYDSLSPAKRQEPKVVSNRVKVSLNCALSLTSLNEFGDAASLLRDAMANAETLVKDFPDVPSYEMDLISVCTNLGIMDFEAGKNAEAAEPLRRAYALSCALRKEFPDLPRSHADVAMTGCNLGSNQRRLSLTTRAPEPLAEAERVLDDANASSRRSLELSPANKEYLGTRAQIGVSTAQLKLTLGKHREAADAAQVIAESAPGDWKLLRTAAGCFARCIPIARADAAAPAAELEAWVESYAEKAISTMRSSVEQGYADVDDIRTSETFAPIRDRAEFQELIAQVEELQQH